jgi:hypothetical protein
MEIEPDGEVRGMPIYEGTVGSLLTEDPRVLWHRSRARWADPFVLENLNRIHTRRDWAEAVRRIDYRFGSPEVRTRIDNRPVHLPILATDHPTPTPGSRIRPGQVTVGDGAGPRLA